MTNVVDRVGVITGAGSGIGRALALDLAGRGTRLALSDVDEAAVIATASMCEKRGVEAVAYGLDVGDREAVATHADEVVDRFGGVHLMFNNAGVALDASVLDMEWKDFDWLVRTNFWGVAHGTKAFLPALIESGGGHLVNISSVFGLVGVPGQSAYNASKFAVRGFTEALRQEMKIAGHPVGVTCVHPGGVKTSIVGHARGMDSRGAPDERDEQFHRIARTTPERAAAVILAGVERNKPRVLIGPDARLFDAVARVVGPRYQDISASLVRRFGPAVEARARR
ncbi:MAG: SDR family oxidoreductase [Rhodococcus sp. (in: high G+C Gram-positive bacteria)]